MAKQQSSVKVERSARMITPVGRASYPHVFAPHAFDANSEAKYSCAVLVEKNPTNNAIVDKLRDLQQLAVDTLYPKKAPANLEWWGIADGDDNDDPTSDGCWIIKGANKQSPAVIDVFKNALDDEDSIYGGADIRLSICAKAYGTATKGGVTFELVAVQKVADNTPFGGAAKARIDAVNEFDDIEGSDDYPF